MESASRFVSALDNVLGPVGHGPSSSHTIGPQRLAFALYEALGGQQVVEAGVEFHNSFAGTWEGHRSHVAVTAGLLGMDPEHVDTPKALELAPWALDMKRFQGRKPHANALVIWARTATHEGVVEANSIGGGNLSPHCPSVRALAVEGVSSC